MFEESAGTSPNFVSWKDKFHGMAPRPNHIYFTKAWPGTNKWTSGRFFEIKRTSIGDYVKSYVLPESDYKELDLSNASAGLKFYPETDNQVHEILIGMKLGNYVLQIDVPNGSPLWKLPESTMIPSKTDSALKYLGAKNPEDSPPTNPTIKFWAIKDMPAIVLRPVLLSGGSFDKVTLTFKVAKHILKDFGEGTIDQNGNIIPPFSGAYDIIPYVEELRWS